MKDLPILIKSPDKDYVIGVDICSEHNNLEIFTYCISYRDGDSIIIQDCKSISNIVEFRNESPIENYIEQLSEFYNTRILIENRIWQRKINSKSIR